MLLQLPQDLLICVLSEWLVVGLKALSVLDVAVGNSRLRTGHWLPLLADLPKLDKCRLPISIRPSLAWMHGRKLQVSRIVVELAALDTVRSVSLRFTFLGTSALVFEDHHYSANPLVLKKFLMMFPNASSVSFANCTVLDRQLLDLADVPLPHLRELDLSECSNITPATVATVVEKQYGSTLQSLSCDVLDDDAISKLAACCRELREINWSLDAVKREHSLLELCAHNPKLTTINLKSRTGNSNRLVTNAFVMRLSLACPQLQVIELNLNDPVDSSVLSVLVANCKQVQTVDVDGIVVTVFKSASGARLCDVHGTTSTLTEQVICMLTALTLPIRAFSCDDHDAVAREDEDDDSGYFSINKQALYLLAKHGSTLERIGIELIGDVQPEDCECLLSSCPNLTVLKLARYDVTFTIDDEAMRRLPLQCPNLVVLELDYSAQLVSTQAVVDMLVGLRNNNMTSLSFNGCQSLTNAVMDAMDELFPNLRQICLTLTSVTRERALEFIIRRCRLLQSFGAPSNGDKKWIRKQLAARKLEISTNVYCA